MPKSATGEDLLLAPAALPPLAESPSPLADRPLPPRPSPSRTPLDTKHHGRVSLIDDAGYFVDVPGFPGVTCYVSQAEEPAGSPTPAPGDEVWVRAQVVIDSCVLVSTRGIDQATGSDLLPALAVEAAA